MKQQSMVDIITNSSSSVYVWPRENSIEATKSFLKEIALAFGFYGDIEEYFEVKYVLDSDYVEEIVDDPSEKDKLILKKYLESKNLSQDDFDNLSYAERKKYYEEIAEIILEMLQNDEYNLGTNFFGLTKKTFLKVCIKPKNGEMFDLWSKLSNVFDYEAIYNG